MRTNDTFDTPDQPAGRFARLSPVMAGALVFAAALVLSFGWVGDHWQLVRPAQDAASIVPLTACCFVLLGLALIIFRAGGRSDKVMAQVLVLAALALIGEFPIVDHSRTIRCKVSDPSVFDQSQEDGT